MIVRYCSAKDHKVYCGECPKYLRYASYTITVANRLFHICTEHAIALMVELDGFYMIRTGFDKYSATPIEKME